MLLKSKVLFLRVICSSLTISVSGLLGSGFFIISDFIDSIILSIFILVYKAVISPVTSIQFGSIIWLRILFAKS